MNMQSIQDGTISKNIRRGRRSQHLQDGAPRFKTDDIRRALFDVQDAMERSQIQFVLLDEIAELLAYGEDPELEASEVSIGVRQQDFTESGSSTLRSIIPQAGWREFIHGTDINNLSYSVGSVPIVIWMITNDLDVFKYPDTRFYYATEFRLPNPFKTYWKQRDLIK